jgi:hypothetical protein
MWRWSFSARRALAQMSHEPGRDRALVIFVRHIGKEEPPATPIMSAIELL